MKARWLTGLVLAIATVIAGQTNQNYRSAQRIIVTDILTDFQWHPHTNASSGNGEQPSASFHNEPGSDHVPGERIALYSHAAIDSQWYNAQTAYYIYSYQYYQRMFDWEFKSSVIIFWMVIFIVFMGILFSGVQFYMALFHPVRHSRRKGAAGEGHSSVDAGAESKMSELEASLHGIKVRSPIIGVVILAISIVFFYLYLKFVYPVTFVGEAAKQTKPAADTVQSASE